MNRKLAFVLAAADTGTLIVNRLDYDTNHQGLGGGACILENGDCEIREIMGGVQTLQALKQTRNTHLMVVDGGANIGYITVAWANAMRGWGDIIAIEPQERVYYALCGNIAINNCTNARAFRAVLDAEPGEAEIPEWDCETPHNSGGCHMDAECDPGAQPIRKVMVRKMAIDALNLPRLDFLKLDIEGMEPKALRGARETIARCKPVLQIEHHVCGMDVLKFHLGQNYEFIPAGINVVCVPKGDPALRFFQPPPLPASKILRP